MRKTCWIMLPTMLFLAALGCAQVPREAVELSTTVGRDLSQAHDAHRELAILLFDRMEGDINQFVDDVYAPYQIRKLLEEEFNDVQKGSSNTLFSALDLALKSPDSAAQTSVVDAMEVFVKIVKEEIEAYRKELLEPVWQQKQNVLSKIENNYLQIHYANSIVTGHLASVVKVHDAQERILGQFGVENFRETVGKDLVNASKKISKLTAKGPELAHSLNSVEEKINKTSEGLKTLWEKF